MGKERSPKKNNTPTKVKLKNEVISKMTELGLWKEELLEEIPTYWDNFSNFVIFDSKFFADMCWTESGSQIWECVSNIFSGKSVAMQGRILNNGFRSPSAKLVFGESPWVEYRDNGINFTWNVQFTMFCTGNVTERHRIATLHCQDEVVVDMFAGIGYFTLPYLVHAKAKQVIACEWNPMSVQALKQNLTMNKVNQRCVVLEGDVRVTCPRGVADRINMGLIPSCEQYWPTAAEILKPSGGTLLVHSNVTSLNKIQDFVHCEKCKSLIHSLFPTINLINVSEHKTFSDFKIIGDEHITNIKQIVDSDGHIKWKKIEWYFWGIHTSHSFCEHLNKAVKGTWLITPTFLHRVKSYAPHIDHLVLDIKCQNESKDN